MSMTFAEELRHVAPPNDPDSRDDYIVVREWDAESKAIFYQLMVERNAFNAAAWQPVAGRGMDDLGDFYHTLHPGSELACWVILRQGKPVLMRVVVKLHSDEATMAYIVGEGARMANNKAFQRALYDVGIRKTNVYIHPSNAHVVRAMQFHGYEFHTDPQGWLITQAKRSERP